MSCMPSRAREVERRPPPWQPLSILPLSRCANVKFEINHYGTYRRSVCNLLNVFLVTHKVTLTEPRKSPKPQPIGNIPIILLFTTCTLCILFILWRRADALRSVVSHRCVPSWSHLWDSVSSPKEANNYICVDWSYWQSEKGRFVYR